MRKLPIAILIVIALPLLPSWSGAAAVRSAVVRSDNCGPAPISLEAIVGPDLYRHQAPLPCMRIYRSVQDRPGQNGEMAVAVAISGGGYRAANFGLGVLLALETLETGTGTNILNEIDYFSTVSGGGFPVAAYIASRYAHEYGRRSSPGAAYSFALAMKASLDNDIAADLRTDLHGALRHAAFKPGLGRNEIIHRRVDALVLDSQLLKRSLTLSDVFVPNCDEHSGGINALPCKARDARRLPMLPYWFANATVVANGAIFPLTPDVLALYDVIGYRHRTDVRPPNPYCMPLAIGLTASASFPGAIPPLTLQSQALTPHGAALTHDIQLVDGGLSDNLGVLTALSVLHQDQRARRKVLIVIDAYTGTVSPYQSPSARLSTVGMLRRSGSVYLDSWRGRHKHVVAAMARGLSRAGEEWKVVFLSFDDIVATQPSLEDQIRRIGTKLQITADQQRAMVSAGESAVNAKRGVLSDVFGVAPTQPFDEIRP